MLHVHLCVCVSMCVCVFVRECVCVLVCVHESRASVWGLLICTRCAVNASQGALAGEHPRPQLSSP
jgi:hypothetical protein